MEGNEFLVIGMFLAGALVVALVPLGLARLWASRYAPAKPGPEKNATYECGVESTGDPWIRFKSEYYLYGIIFLIFDVEILFLLPFAVAFTSLTPGAFVVMMLFLLLLVEGLVWAWQKGLLAWGTRIHEARG
jgi:NADH-quinone oxidoreductase subunit A